MGVFAVVSYGVMPAYAAMFSDSPEVIREVIVCGRIVCVASVGQALKSSLLTVIRTMVLFVPLGYLFSRLGLDRFWLTFICTEVLTSVVGFAFYRQFLQHPGFRESDGFCAARD